MLGFPFAIRAEHSMRSGAALFLFVVFLLLAPLQAANAQPERAPERAKEAAKSLELQEAQTLYTRDSEVAGKVPAEAWLIEQNRTTRDDGGCTENRWVEVEYTPGLAATVETEEDLQVLYFCDSDLEGDPQETIARPFYNFRAFLGGTTTIVGDGSALFREVKDKHRPLLESLRRDLESGRVQPQVQVTVAGSTLAPDTLMVVEGGIRIPVGTELEQAAEERRAIFEWSENENGVRGITDYAQIPGRPEVTLQMEPEPESESSEGTFPWWALALIGILTTLAVALGLFLYWERREKEKLEDKVRELQGKIGELEEKLQGVRSGRDLKKELLNQVQKPQEWKEELRGLLHEQLPETADHPTSPEEIESLREEVELLSEELESLQEGLLETSVQGVTPEDIEELSHKIEALFSHLQERDASGEGHTEDRHLQLPIDELEVPVLSSPLPLKPGKEEASGAEDRDQEDDSLRPSAKSLLRSIDRTAPLNRMKEDMSGAKQEEQREAPGPDTQTDAGASVAEEKSLEDAGKQPEQEGSLSEVDPDFTSVHNRCRDLVQKYSGNNPKKKNFAKNIMKLLRHTKKNYREGIKNEKNAAKKLAVIFMKAWDPGSPEESLEVLYKATSETEGKWDFYYSPGGTAYSDEEIRRSSVSDIALDKIKDGMENESIPDGEVSTITPGIDWKGRGERQEISYTPIQYRADYSSFSVPNKNS